MAWLPTNAQMKGIQNGTVCGFAFLSDFFKVKRIFSRESDHSKTLRAAKLLCFNKNLCFCQKSSKAEEKKKLIFTSGSSSTPYCSSLCCWTVTAAQTQVSTRTEDNNAYVFLYLTADDSACVLMKSFL